MTWVDHGSVIARNLAPAADCILVLSPDLATDKQSTHLVSCPSHHWVLTQKSKYFLHKYQNIFARIKHLICKKIWVTSANRFCSANKV